MLTYPVGIQVLVLTLVFIHMHTLRMRAAKALVLCAILLEPLHEISNNVVCATSKGSDQPAHTRSLIGAFTSRLNILGVLSY